MDFYIDNIGENEEQQTTSDEIKQIIAEYKQSVKETEVKVPKKSMFDAFEEEIGWNKTNLKNTKHSAVKINDEVTHVRREVDELLKKSVITSQFEDLHNVPQYDMAEKQRKLLRKREAVKTKGNKWYGLPATEVTNDVKRELQVLQMRSALDPKRFYKKNDLKVLPKYFQIGKVIDSHLDYYNGRLTKKERKKTLVDELLTDAEFNKYNKRKYKEIIEQKQATSYKAWKQAKKSKKKSKRR
ncbi:hypothetical protein RN001_004368 [Aquatica leii]|uniref:Fcf2 pre-rRNA processing C-terminal domain-containing protein n=1 Tax=Aquatica leii TaxID=1421715 RepID=A0AAN7PB98_9COLE|nr:hypothetical protein RN001_004368 [Aquatica leii]